MPVAPEFPLAIEADALSVSLGGIPVLRDISMNIAEGEVVSLVGANGSGKSTLVRALLGLVSHQHGEVKIFDTPLDNFQQWSRIGYVPQSSTVSIQKATVKEVTAMGRLAHRRCFRPASVKDKSLIKDSLDLVNMGDQLNRQFVHLSGGQQQRVLIARALASEADLFIMDEPLAGIDMITQEALADVIKSLQDDGKTCLLVLHETGPLKSLIDRRIALYDGRIIPTQED